VRADRQEHLSKTPAPIDGNSRLMIFSQALDTSRQFDDGASPLASHSETEARGETAAIWSSLLPLDGGNIYVSQDGPHEAPALVLIHGLAASTRWWDALIPLLARSHRVIRIDLLGHGRSAKPASGGYGIPEQGKRVGAALDRLGVKCAIVVGHSTGGSVATALAELRRDQVKALALINSCPCLDADTSPGLLSRLLPVPVVGHLMWRLLTGALTRKAMTNGFARGFEIPQQLVDDVRGVTYNAFTATSRAALDYLEQRSLPDRLAVLGTPLLVMFGEEDRRCRSSSAAGYRAVPGARIELLNGIGHSPMVEDPPRTAALLQVFTASVLSAE
jgi:pimeloyl-ACP methyl ester carboxylesterase